MNLQHMTAEQVIDALDMEFLEGEGCWISLLWRTQSANAIYALMTPQDFSALHRLQEDEAWTYIAGAPAQMLLLHPDGTDQLIALGADVDGGQVPHHLIPANAWQGTITTGEWTLASCVLVPAFTEFELATDETDLSAWSPVRHHIAARMRNAS